MFVLRTPFKFTPRLTLTHVNNASTPISYFLDFLSGPWPSEMSTCTEFTKRVFLSGFQGFPEEETSYLSIPGLPKPYSQLK